VAALLALACGPGQPPCDFEQQLRTLAGSTAIDCGHYLVGDDASEGTRCALRAQEAGQAFRLRVEQPSVEGPYPLGFARSRQGDTFLLRADPRGESSRTHCEQGLSSQGDVLTCEGPRDAGPLCG
jgi:hypothetical protein